VPDIDLLAHLPVFFDGLFHMLADPNKEIRQQTFSVPRHGRKPALAVPRLTALASWGGLSRILAALRTRDAQLSRRAAHGPMGSCSSAVVRPCVAKVVADPAGR
jgi:hypothetical protein